MKVLVTGGGGFLGSALITKLIEQGHAVHAIQRGQYPHLQDQGVQCFAADLAKNQALIAQAVQGCDTVFHVAAKAGVWGSYDDYYKSNVQATRHLLEASRNAGVKYFVYTSSPSVVFGGTDESGITEATAYPNKYLAFYPQTKAIAERDVLAANKPGFATVALRPHLIWGPGDRHLVPRVINRARAGKLKLVGPGDNLVDSTYIDNAVHAQLLAAEYLLTRGHEGGGKAYFISNDQPIPMKDLLNGILKAANLPPVQKHISVKMAYVVGCVMEGLWKLCRIQREPLMTRFVARQLSCAHWFDLSAAKNDLGYTPLVTIEQGMARLAESLESK